MSRDALKTLFHPFETGVIDPPGEGERVLFLGAEAGYRLPEGFGASIAAVQPLRPLYRALEAQRADVAPVVTGEDYDVALILCGRHKGENEDRIAEALKRTRDGALIVIAGGKEDGIQSLRKRIAKFEWDGDHLPKYHGVAFWFTRPEDVTDAVQKLAKVPVRVDGLFEASPGMFSHDRIDAGSELLASRLPRDFNGHAADFGAGWGYLAVKLAETSPGTKGIDLFEADHDALEAARVNMMANAPRMPARFYWFDLTGEEPRDKYDLIVMNPPFHEGHAAEPSLGVAIIKAAHKALKQGGKVMLVANRGLQYEQTLAETFKEYGETCRNARFKVLWGKR
ncbi:Ribosomal RNA small subunit methyltransferase C [Ensifer sp. M14]|jgi:16S rRNA (guanine1207-N2)-methyltransferase|uniref:class I SAM-dependent methyltransferase n=1 Tax=Sinorhizobium/Ensifer group TaxID=227292 RepID=UPI000984ADAD|nr:MULTISPECIES: class I SAM-dependent methyltransferase [Sinorhizobium/Ensifer group]OOG74388.1 methyltransferase [Sinorhizobium sp. A49]RDL49331.1 Ribosomal RNA small subunit methyltransferase C [Ensifer sp. M14]